MIRFEFDIGRAQNQEKHKSNFEFDFWILDFGNFIFVCFGLMLKSFVLLLLSIYHASIILSAERCARFSFVIICFDYIFEPETKTKAASALPDLIRRNRKKGPFLRTPDFSSSWMNPNNCEGNILRSGVKLRCICSSIQNHHPVLVLVCTHLQSCFSLLVCSAQHFMSVDTLSHALNAPC